jgi:hypothetical protein
MVSWRGKKKTEAKTPDMWLPIRRSQNKPSLQIFPLFPTFRFLFYGGQMSWRSDRLPSPSLGAAGFRVRLELASLSRTASCPSSNPNKSSETKDPLKITKERTQLLHPN